MEALASGDRIYIFLSRAYLDSIYCMTELHGIWGRCERDGEAFSHRVRVYIADDIIPGDADRMLDVETYWREKRERFESIPITDPSDSKRADAMKIRQFAEHTYDILGLDPVSWTRPARLRSRSVSQRDATVRGRDPS